MLINIFVQKLISMIIKSNLYRKISSIFLIFILFYSCNNNERTQLNDIEIEQKGIGKVLVFGNSITKHPITPFWWGEWGMAASTRENDWVHQLQSKLRIKNEDAMIQALNIADWERNLNSYDISQLDTYLVSDIECVIFKIGENVQDKPNFETSLNLLVQKVKTKVPKAQILIVGSFWPLQEIEIILTKVAKDQKCSFVSLAYMWDKQDVYQAKLNTNVFGDDNQWHVISDGGDVAIGVASHPNDFAMQAIASDIAKILIK